jgi:hypothetical protein
LHFLDARKARSGTGLTCAAPRDNMHSNRRKGGKRGFVCVRVGKQRASICCTHLLSGSIYPLL